MELWIPITIGAAFLQNLRSAGQKHLKSRLSNTGATFVRFGYGLPFAFAFLLLLVALGDTLPEPGYAFAGWAVLGAAAQIAATFLLLYLFEFRNFAVGTAYSRTEPAQAALFGLVLLGERVSLGTITAIAISVIGVMLISVAHTAVTPRSLIGSMFRRNALIGLASGTLFGISAVAYRAASLELGGPNFLMQAAFTLCIVIALQTLSMLAWIALREPAQLRTISAAWRPALFVGAAGAAASFGWFAAMTLQQAAIVKALAQIEMLFTFAASILFFGERINRREIAGCLLIVTGIVVLVLVG